METTRSSTTAARTSVTHSSAPHWLTPLVALALLASGCAYGSYDDSDLDQAATKEQAVYHGSTDMSSHGYLKYRTAQITRKVGKEIKPGCSGTFLDPLTVLTAAHCVAKGGNPFGSLRTPSDLRIQSADSKQDAVKGREIKSMADHDVALIFLEDEFFEPDGDPIFTPLDPYPPSDYKDENITISGWGANVRAYDGRSPFGTLRWGRMKVVDDYVRSKRSKGEITLHTAKLKWLSSEQNFRAGDSGGPAWGNRTYPRGVFGVASVNDKNNAWVARSAHIMDWVHLEIEGDHGFQQETLDFKSRSDLDDSVRRYSPVGAPAHWAIENGDLVQYDNVPNSPIIWKRFVGRQFFIKTEIENAEDNDAAGLTFRFVNDDNYYYCEVNDQHNYLRIRRRYHGKETTLAETPWTGDLSKHHSMMVTSTDDFEYECAIFIEGGADFVSVTATDKRLPVGYYGLWQDHNKGVRFSYLRYYGSIFSPEYD